jgi:toxin-antitoxin system PIN domain toxin
MILTDINILLYAHNADDERFDRASAWFEDLMNGAQLACFCWETINGFIRISTNDKTTPKPYTLREAFLIVEEWLQRPNAIMLEPAKEHRKVLQKISIEANATGNLYSDAILAALAISHDATVASTDRDFRLFDGLKLINPLTES